MSLREEYKKITERFHRKRLESGPLLVPGPQTLWLHIESNKIYQVVQMVKGAGDLHGTSMVLYRDPDSLATYVRPLPEWHLKFINVDKLNRKRTFHMNNYPIYVEEHECIYEMGGLPHKSMSIHFGNTTLGMMGPECLKMFYHMFKDHVDPYPEQRNRAEAISAALENVLAHPERYQQ